MKENRKPGTDTLGLAPSEKRTVNDTIDYIHHEANEFVGRMERAQLEAIVSQLLRSCIFQNICRRELAEEKYDHAFDCLVECFEQGSIHLRAILTNK